MASLRPMSGQRTAAPPHRPAPPGARPSQLPPKALNAPGSFGKTMGRCAALASWPRPPAEDIDARRAAAARWEKDVGGTLR